MEYFELEKDFWIARWLKKPNKEIIKQGERYIKNNKIVVRIGITDSIIETVTEEFNQQMQGGKYDENYEVNLEGISVKMQMPKALILMILEKKELIK